jgi:hypothetical protein
MGDPDPNPDSLIVGRHADTADTAERGPQGTNGEGLTDQLNQTTSEDAGGNVSGTGPESFEDLNIIFEAEESDEVEH